VLHAPGTLLAVLQPHMVRKVWARTTGGAAVAPRAVVLIGDPREWPRDFESLLTAEGYAAGHLPELEAVIPIVEAAAVRALFVVARPLGASDLLILRRIRQTSPQTGIVVVARSPTNPDLKLAFESGATAFLSWPASKEAVRQAVDSGSVPAAQDSRLRS
jgi:DNA-binding NtrC family response regulator